MVTRWGSGAWCRRRPRSSGSPPRAGTAGGRGGRCGARTGVIIRVACPETLPHGPGRRGCPTRSSARVPAVTTVVTPRRRGPGGVVAADGGAGRMTALIPRRHDERVPRSGAGRSRLRRSPDREPRAATTAARSPTSSRPGWRRAWSPSPCAAPVRPATNHLTAADRKRHRGRGAGSSGPPPPCPSPPGPTGGTPAANASSASCSCCSCSPGSSPGRSAGSTR